LVPRQRQQQIERSLKAFDINHQRLLALRKLGREFGREFRFVDGHAIGTRVWWGDVSWHDLSWRSRFENSALNAAMSPTPLRRCASAALARCAAVPVSPGAASAASPISSSWPLQWSTTSQPAASAARARTAIDPDKAPIEISSLISKPPKPIQFRI